MPILEDRPPRELPAWARKLAKGPERLLRVRKNEQQVRNMVAELRLLGESYWEDGRGARWLIGRPGSNFARTEIIAGICGSLVLHGDLPSCRFATNNTRTAFQRLLWIADTTDMGYVTEKARVGDPGLPSYDYDPDVARADLWRDIREIRQADGAAAHIELLTVAARQHADSEYELVGFLTSHGFGDEALLGYGRVAGYRVVAAHACAQRCAELLRKKHGEDGPPACRRLPEVVTT